jgi:hypothetical protein
MNFKSKLRFVFDTTTTGFGDPAGSAVGNRRYIAKAFAAAGSGWGVFDRLDNRFLSDREVKKLSPTDLAAEMGRS